MSEHQYRKVGSKHFWPFTEMARGDFFIGPRERENSIRSMASQCSEKHRMTFTVYRHSDGLLITRIA